MISNLIFVQYIPALQQMRKAGHQQLSLASHAAAIDKHADKFCIFQYGTTKMTRFYAKPQWKFYLHSMWSSILKVRGTELVLDLQHFPTELQRIQWDEALPQAELCRLNTRTDYNYNVTRYLEKHEQVQHEYVSITNLFPALALLLLLQPQGSMAPLRNSLLPL